MLHDIFIVMQHLEGLNEKQKEAVLYKEGPLLIVAGAGAGNGVDVAEQGEELRILPLPRPAAAAVRTGHAHQFPELSGVRTLPDDFGGSSDGEGGVAHHHRLPLSFSTLPMILT